MLFILNKLDCFTANYLTLGHSLKVIYINDLRFIIDDRFYANFSNLFQ